MFFFKTFVHFKLLILQKNLLMIIEEKKAKTVKRTSTSPSELAAKETLRSVTIEENKKSATLRKAERPNYRYRLL